MNLRMGIESKFSMDHLKGVEAVFKKDLKDGERAVILFEILSSHQEAQVNMEDLIKSED